MSDQSPEQAARRRGRIALVLDQEGADFYIELFNEYNRGRKQPDVAVSDDETYLRGEYAIVFGEDADCDAGPFETECNVVDLVRVDTDE